MTLPTGPAPTLRRARAAVYIMFLIPGIAIGVWTSRIPALKERLDLGDGQLSLALLAIAAGALAGMQIVGRLVDRHGSGRVMVPLAFAQGAVLLLPAAMPSLITLAASLALFGAAHGMLDVSMNANAVEVERAWGRPLMSSFHAVFSIGGFLGAAGGGLFAHAGIGPWPTFAATGTALAALALITSPWALRTTPRPRPTTLTAGTTAPRVPKIQGVLFLGVLGFCCMVGEGASADWGSVYLREDLASSPGFAAAAYAAFSIMMTAGRLAGDRLAVRLGPVTLVRYCGILAGAGLVTALLIGHPVAGVIGFGCFGAGLSCIVPQVFSAAGHRDPARAGQALARVASLGYLGFLTGPVLIGAAAEVLGLPRALAIPAMLALFVALAARALRAAPTSATPEPQHPATGAPGRTG
ncbi:MFS transporter [Sphaerisporangium corydalis]|uniref:MFS transporter n=1 Tax=Sphaerisporangium corydalis TaxID=1441875 RepID=A0ABV9ESU1_9ACTN|nr:MFS transporter [Sphaerisporangium corydalis]